MNRNKYADDYKKLCDFDWDPNRLRSSSRECFMLSYLRDFTLNCSMCPLGRQKCSEHNEVFDPHVFSNMKQSKFMVVGQNPGFNECKQGEPFVGDAGRFFNECVESNGLSRGDFYISNVVKCHTVGNECPSINHVDICEGILRLEISILKPYLVVTLGALSLGSFCPNLKLSEVVGKLVKSDRFGVNVFPIFHPSPRNMSSEHRRGSFIKCIKLLCKVVSVKK